MFRLITLGLLLTISTQLSAQPIVTEVSPRSASPGDEIVLRGSFLVAVTHVRFTATVGGFLGIDVRNVAVTSATSSTVTVTVPSMAAFVPPNATPPSSPLGSLTVRDAGGLLSAPETFYFHEGSYLDAAGQTPLLTSIGLGTTNSSGLRAATSFNVANGAPNLPGGNPNFELTLENATPNSAVLLVFGQPATPPMTSVGDGLVGIDLLAPFTIWPSPPVPASTDANGRVVLPTPIPGGGPLGVAVTVGWAYVDSVTAEFRVASGITANL